MRTIALLLGFASLQVLAQETSEKRASSPSTAEAIGPERPKASARPPGAWASRAGGVVRRRMARVIVAPLARPANRNTRFARVSMDRGSAS